MQVGSTPQKIHSVHYCQSSCCFEDSFYEIDEIIIPQSALSDLKIMFSFPLLLLKESLPKTASWIELLATSCCAHTAQTAYGKV